MDFCLGHNDDGADLAELYRHSFAAWEGQTHGDLIYDLFLSLVATTPTDDLHVFSAWEGDIATGCIAFSQMRYADDPRHVILLSPVAVAPDHQRKGVGQALINHGLAQMRNAGAEVAVTYGDPNYYMKCGFIPVTEDEVPPPHRLSMPHGWQARCLDGEKLRPIEGTPVCAEAWNDPSFW